MPVVGDVLVEHRHLSPTDTRTDIAHAIVVTDLLMLIIRVTLARLCRIEHHIIARFLIRTDQSPATRSGDHLVAIERQDTIGTECSAHLPFIS